MAEEKTPQEQVKEALWRYTGWAVIILACIGAGTFIGFTAWGDAPELRKEVERLGNEINELKNERESLQTQVAMASRDRDGCEARVQQLQEQLSAREEAPAEE